MIKSFSGEYRFLSNFFPSYVLYNGKTYRTVENAYQAAKTRSKSWRLQIRMASPGQAKKIGQKVPLRAGWEEMKRDVMKGLLVSKFTDPVLSCSLRLTGNQELIEGNTWHDNIWGSCTCHVCNDRGQNWLGQLLMEVRKEREKEKEDGKAKKEK